MSDRPLFQSLLDIGLSDHATFANFVGRDAVVKILRDHVTGDETGLQLIYLWGEAGSGRTHLLQAACNAAQGAGRGVLYVPLAGRNRFDPAQLTVRPGIDQVCLDDIDAVCGDRVWEETLFHLLNDTRDRSVRVLAAARIPPSALQMVLPDLQSRLAAALVQHIAALADAEKEQVIRRRAAARGLAIGDEEMRYLLSHAHRDMGSLLTILDELDRETVVQQRRITIPFLKKVLGL